MIDIPGKTCGVILPFLSGWGALDAGDGTVPRGKVLDLREKFRSPVRGTEFANNKDAVTFSVIH
jgi:hypothetical protein